MRKIISVFVIFLLVLSAEAVIGIWVSSHYPFNPFYKTLWSIGFRLLLIAIGLSLLKRYDLSGFSGLNRKLSLKSWLYILLPTLLLMPAFFAQIPLFSEGWPNSTLLFFLKNLFVGVTEELFFRGLVFALLLKTFQGNFIKAIFGNAFLFGLAHLFNLFFSPFIWFDVISIILFPFALGVVFSALMVRVKNLWLVALLHGLVNISMDVTPLKKLLGYEIEYTSGTFSLTNALVTLGFYALLLGLGLILLHGSDEDKDQLKSYLPANKHS